ncbi:hypothetical protein VNI00_009649 [Paramarasmius palmivorus]|uniref:CFEM domain-containing protein n=1 Tax=Paramarasmius palmivorus TaxID=297713 RepID=A0AAW0CRL1_9AGAR
MYSSAALLILAALTTSVSAQNLPTCAFTCVASADTGSCGMDNKCLCSSQAFVESTTKCIMSSCTGDDLQAAVAGAQQLCADAGVTLSVPSASSTAPSSSNTSGSATSAGSAQTTAPSNAAVAPGINIDGIAAIVGAGFAILAL